MADPRRTQAGLRARQLRRDGVLAADLTREYGQTWQRIRAELDDLGQQIKQARDRGETVNRGWLLKQHRLQRLEAETLVSLRFFLDFAERRITAAQIDALTAGQTDALEVLRASIGAPPPGVLFESALPAGALNELVGRSSSGQPLGELLAQLGPHAATGVRRTLLAGVALGQHPSVIARAARTFLAGNMARALTIARTEVLGAYRAASLDTYRANSGVVSGWVWNAQLSQRTCAVCWAMHGTFHTLDEALGSHPNCRCAMLPKTRSWAELGFDAPNDPGIVVEPGPDVFRRADPALQRAVLGPAKYELYRRGELDLPELVQKTRSRTWGVGRRERPLRELPLVA